MGKEEAAAHLTVDGGFVWSKFVEYKDRLNSYRHLGWIILLASAVNVILIGGKRRAFGIFVTALHNDFTNTSMTELNWIGDSYAAVGFFLMPFMTTLIVHAGRAYRVSMVAAGAFIFVSCFTSAAVPSPGYLFVTHTLLHGIGSTLILCTTALITGEYFDKTHRFHVLATAFVSGGPYGVLIFGPLFSLWIHEYGWRVAFEICGVVFLGFNLLAAIFFQPKQSDHYEPVEHTASSGRGWAVISLSHLKENAQIVLWALERLIHNFVMYGLLMNMTTYVTEAMENEIQEGSKVNLYFGIGESIVFTVGALIGDKIRGRLPIFYMVGAAIAAIILLVMQSLYKDVTTVLVLAGFLGAAVGTGNTFLYATSEEVMLIHGSVAFPMTKSIAGVGMLLAPFLSGTVIDMFSFRGFFISMAVLVCFRVLLFIAICIILWRKKIQRSQRRLAEGTKLHPPVTAKAEGPLYPCEESEHVHAEVEQQ
uniref:MFS domain-containing protein n=1 Tax=Mesocestoides corti TaxID=53468 RepID=A0A5K3F2K6_MESCO